MSCLNRKFPLIYSLSDLITIRKILTLAVFSCLLHGELAAAISVDVLVNRDATARQGSNLTLPAGTNDLRFFVKPQSLSVRYKLEGLDEDWKQDPMLVLRLPLDYQ